MVKTWAVSDTKRDYKCSLLKKRLLRLFAYDSPSISTTFYLPNIGVFGTSGGATPTSEAISFGANPVQFSPNAGPVGHGSPRT